MITSRGCSYAKCSYCEMSKLVRRNFRRHSPERVVREMKALVSMTGARDLYFQDDIFITDEAWVREFCDRLDEAALDVIWSCESRFRRGDRGPAATNASVWMLADLLRIRDWEPGTAGPDPEGIHAGRGTRGRPVRAAAGLEVVGFFMLGLPGETPEMGRRTSISRCRWASATRCSA